jgi:hypothetical protein
MVISHIGTEPGCVTELVYEIRDREPPLLPVGGRIPHAGRHPVLDRRIVVATPAPVKHAVKAAGDLVTLTTERTTESARHLLLSSATNAPAIPPEDGWPDDLDVTPHLVFSTATNWETIAAAWRVAGDAALNDTTGVARWIAEPRGGRPAASTDLPADLSPLAPVRQAAAIIGDRLATVDPPTGPWSRAPRSVSAVLASGVATPWEKGIVARALLAAAGAAAEIGFFTPGTSFAADVPTASAFAQVRVVLPAAGENWWLSPHRETPFPGRCDLPGRTGLILEAASPGHRRYTVGASPSQAWLAVVVRPAPDGDGERPWLAEIEYDAAGALWPSGQSGEEVAAKLAAAVLPGGEVGSVDEEVVGTDRGRIRLTARAPALAAAAHGSCEIPLPGGPIPLSAALPGGNPLTATPRQTPLYVERGLQWQLRLRLELPDSLVADYLPPTSERSASQGAGQPRPGTHDEPVAVARFARQTENTGRSCRLQCELTLPAGWIAADEVPAWREVVRAVLAPAATTVVVAKP